MFMLFFPSFLQPGVIHEGNKQQVKDLIRSAFVTDTNFFENTQASGNGGANKQKVKQKAVEAWSLYLGRYGYLTMANKKALISLVETVIREVPDSKKYFRGNMITCIQQALNDIPLGVGVIIDEEEAQPSSSFTIPESIQHQQQEDLNTSNNSLFGGEFQVSYRDEREPDLDDRIFDNHLECLLGLGTGDMIPPTATSSSSYGVATSSSSSSNAVYQNEMDMLRQENERLKCEERRLLKDSQDESEFLQDQVSHLQQELDGLRKQVLDVQAFKKQVEVVEVERDKFKKQVEVVEVERDGLRKQVELDCVRLETIRMDLEEEVQHKESFRTHLINVKKQWKELRGKLEDVEKTLLGAVEVDIYDAETEVEDNADVGEKRKRGGDNDSEISRESKRAKTDINVLILNKLAHQSIIAHDASKAWRPKIQSLYEEFIRDEKYLQKVWFIFNKAHGKTTDAFVKEQATIMMQFMDEIVNV